MAAPNPPTALTITQVQSGSAAVTLSWSHDGTGPLDRFEVLSKSDTDTIWTSVKLAPKADFGTGPYSLTTASPEGMRWAVRALNAAGEVSV